MITSKDNKKVKHARSLYSVKNRKQTGQFIVEGKHLVEMAKKSGSIDYILTTNESYEGILISSEVMQTIVKTVSDIEVVAVCNRVSISSTYNKVLVLDNIQDPGNLGTLIRSALAFNFDTVVCSLNCVDMYNDKVIRSTAGALFSISIVYMDLVKYLKESSNYTIGTFVDGDSKLEIIDNVNIVIGNEGNGISKEVEALCDSKYRIDINEKLESINAAVTGSILMWQFGGKDGIS